jgi:outer membrane protein TolC
MKNTHISLLLALSLSMAGCAAGRHPVGPNYARPVITPAPFHNLDAAKAVKTDLPQPKLDAWWTGFEDPLLVTLVQWHCNRISISPLRLNV